jgi:hypothetical protein
MVAAADGLQARRLRQCLDEERAKVAAQLGKHAKILNECATSGEVVAISHHRGRIRQLENEIRTINRMLDALDSRFPEFDEERRP